MSNSNTTDPQAIQAKIEDLEKTIENYKQREEYAQAETAFKKKIALEKQLSELEAKQAFEAQQKRIIDTRNKQNEERVNFRQEWDKRKKEEEEKDKEEINDKKVFFVLYCIIY